MKTTSHNKNRTVIKVLGVTFTLDKSLEKYAKYIPEKVKENEALIAKSHFKF